MPAPAGVESPWLVPSVCKLPDERSNRYVSFVGDGADRCPARPHSTPQTFTLPAGLDWAPEGETMAFVAYRGERDRVTISFTLTDAAGNVLLQETGANLGGTKVRSFHHASGFGRYYEDGFGCERIERGCEKVVHEYLSRETFRRNFTVGAGLAFPLTLAVTQLDVQRDNFGPPSVFLTLYSPTGGRSTDTLSNKMYSLAWVPIGLFLLCLCKLVAACTADDPLVRKAAPRVAPDAEADV